ncbi:hypothetical protein Pla100_57620 [Neorhodopirellula pilleata]|uniref:DUF2304 domain-containing protein n=2 Tax=Neorhodopirellula pilleata TaxID=2714738 RepID=A0A5C5ZME7_9BACT|nr:hypothetical protein Pla100_57620 [Neorhodopirellula pilleata]
MTLFQWIVVPLLSVFLLLEIHGMRSGRIRRTVRLARILLWAGAILLTLFPNVTSKLAILVGIGRGVDLIVYIFMIVASVAWLHMQTQHQRLQRSIVELARSQTLQNPVKDLSQS